MDEQNTTHKVTSTIQSRQPASQPEIGTGTWLLMLGTALFFDTTGALLNLIPPPGGQILEELNDMIADATFWLWFKVKSAKYSKITMFGSFILKFIPFLNLLPEYTVMIIIMYIQARGKKLITRKGL